MIISYTFPQISCVIYVIVIFHFGLFFALLRHWQPKKSKFKKSEKNTWRYHHFIIVYQKSWSNVTDVIIFHFGPFFALLQPEKSNLKKWKKAWRYHHFTQGHQKSWYCSWDMVRGRCNCYFSFWAIFCSFNPLKAQKVKIEKKIKKGLEVSSLYIWVPKIMIRWCTIPEIWCATYGQTDGRTDGWKKWHIEVDGPPKNVTHFT